MTGQPYPGNVPPRKEGPKKGFFDHWFPLIRPAIKPLFLRGNVQ